MIFYDVFQAYISCGPKRPKVLRLGKKQKLALEKSKWLDGKTGLEYAQEKWPIVYKITIEFVEEADCLKFE